jgi:hypothetical protein
MGSSHTLAVASPAATVIFSFREGALDPVKRFPRNPPHETLLRADEAVFPAHEDGLKPTPDINASINQRGLGHVVGINRQLRFHRSGRRDDRRMAPSSWS